MKIISKEQAINVKKPEGTNVTYFIFDEYELHYNEQIPHSTQTWHHHEKIWETIYILEGELTAQWQEGQLVKEQIVKTGYLIETQRTPHTFINHTDKTVKFLVLKQLLSGTNKKELLKSDKIVDPIPQ